jgi:UDPglucose--hexose-1-phosphate uridylyltransferase
MAYRLPPVEPNGPNWTVRVVPNKFPALQVEGDIDRQGLGLYDRMNGIGAHEVIIETPNHTDSLADMPTKRIEDVLWAYRDRMIDLKKESRRIGRCHIGAQPLTTHRTADHPHQRARRDRGLPGSL